MPSAWILAVLLDPAFAIRVESGNLETHKLSQVPGKVLALQDAVSSKVYRGGESVAACEVLASTLKQQQAACTLDDFLKNSWLVALELDCVLHRAQNSLDLLATRFELVAKEEVQTWTEFVEEWTEQTGISDDMSMAELQERCQAHPLSRMKRWPSACDLRGCKHAVGQLFANMSGRSILVRPQREATGRAYSYEGEVRELRSWNELQHVNATQINRGLWYASLLARTEDFRETQANYFPGLRLRLYYTGSDPAIVLPLVGEGSSGANAEEMCGFAENKNPIDTGNFKEYFSQSSAVKDTRSARRPFWRQIANDVAIASKVVFDDESPMGTVSADVDMINLSKSFLNKFTITPSSYALLANREGEILAISEAGKSVFGGDGCRLADSVWQRRHCRDARSSNISHVLADLGARRFHGDETSCSTQMVHNRVHFAKGQIHSIAVCAFSAVPDWIFLVGSMSHDITDAAKINVSATLQKPAPDSSQLQVYHRGAKDLQISGKVEFREESDMRQSRNMTILLEVINVGAIPFPMPKQASLLVDHDSLNEDWLFVTFDPEVTEVGPWRHVYLKVTLCIACLPDFGTFHGHIQLQADREARRGYCFADSFMVRLRLQTTEYTFVKTLRKVAMYFVLPTAVLAVIGLLTRTTIRRKYKNEALQLKRVEEVLSSVNKLAFPMVVMSAATFKELGQLVNHEEAQEQHALVWLYTMDDVEEFSVKNHVIFVSHQWTAFDTPDPTKIQYTAMVMSLDTLKVEKRWEEQHMYLWVDYYSIPQRHKGTQLMAINSLTAYASRVDAFVVIAPNVMHKDLEEVCDKETYQCRAWCRAEQLSHLLARGTANMYLAEKNELTPLTSINNWLVQSYHVFQGDLTCCRREHVGMQRCDKEFLVTPMLGLWAQLCVRAESASGDDDEATREAVAIYDSLKSRLDDIFPRTFTFKDPTGVKERPLFSDLTDRLVDALQEQETEGEAT